MSSRRYVHALGYRWLNRLYDPLIRLTMAERQFKEQLLTQASVSPSMRVLDVGCGTGTLLLQAAARGVKRPIGLDGDVEILRLARGKVQHNIAAAGLVAGLSTAMPFPAQQFDRAFSTLMLHHLDDSEKLATLSEIRRVLPAEGELHIADWGRPHTRLMRLAARLVSAFDGRDVTRANLEGRIPDLCRQAGFSEVQLRAERATPFGTLAFYRARKGVR
ncbi:MAG: class I SAM-dependent methyltransferase [Vicinamibacterales bacterium]